MMREIEVLTGNGVALNTSLNHRVEAIVCVAESRVEHVLRLRSESPILVVKYAVDPYE